MPYHYLEDIGTADIAFEATGRDLPELFMAAADATMNVMIDNLDAIEPRETRQIKLSNDNIEMLLFDFLQELIYFKDARRLLLRARETQIDHKDEEYFLKATVDRRTIRCDSSSAARRRESGHASWFLCRENDPPGAGWKAKVLLDI